MRALRILVGTIRAYSALLGLSVMKAPPPASSLVRSEARKVIQKWSIDAQLPELREGSLATPVSVFVTC